MRVRLLDLPELSPNAFQPDNGCNWLHVPAPCHLDIANGVIRVDDDYELVGWCRNMHPHLMHGREGQIGIMLFNDEIENLWQHYPLFNTDDFEAARFDTKRRPLEAKP